MTFKLNQNLAVGVTEFLISFNCIFKNIYLKLTLITYKITFIQTLLY